MASKTSPPRNGFGLVGKHVGFGYRGAHPQGHVTGIRKQGTTRATTEFNVMPRAQDRHPGEPLPVHRYGSNLHTIDSGLMGKASRKR